jgi:tetratricopeptide (TPR) repeat protein/DNA-binding XRE family transcriptional regulator
VVPIASDTTVGVLLRRLRKAANLSQEELAERAGISTQAVSAIERGERRRPYPRTLRALMDALEASAQDRAALVATAAAHGAPADDSPLAGTAMPRVAQLPGDVGDFTGRVEEQAAIAAWLRQVEGRLAGRICAIAGKAGVGKSTLAVHVAHVLAPEFPDVQLYVNLRGQDAEPRSSSAVLVGFLHALGATRDAVPPQLEEQAALYRSLLAGRRALVLLDNVRDEAQVRPLLPGAPTCAVLVTGRQRLVALAGAELFDLDDMTTPDALELLGRVAGPSRVTRQREAAERIVAFCGRLPLAVRIAGATLSARPHWPLSRLASRLADERTRLDALHAGDLDVRASVELGHRELREGDARLFGLLGLLPGSGFALDVVAALAGEDENTTEDALERLCHSQLVQATDDGRYHLHDLVRLVAAERARQGDPAPNAEALERALRRWLATALRSAVILQGPTGRGVLSGHSFGETPGAVQAAVRHFENEWTNLVAAADRAGDMGRWDIALGLAEALQPFFAVQFQGSAEERMHQLGLRAARELDDRSAEIRFLHHLGTSYRIQALWQQAVPCYEQSLAIAREVGDGRGEARALNGLGRIHRERGELEAARACYEASTPIFRQIGDRDGEGNALNGLGVVLSNQGHEDASADCYLRSLALLREVGDRHSEGSVLTNLGDHLRTIGRLDEAADCYEQHLAICDDLHDGECASAAHASLAEVRTQQERWGEAMQRGEQALALALLSGARDCQARALQAIGATHRARRRWDEAVSCYQQSLAIWRERGARQNECWCLNHLGEVRTDEGRGAQAAAFFEQSLAIARELRLPHEEEVILRRLADVRAAQEDASDRHGSTQSDATGGA